MSSNEQSTPSGSASETPTSATQLAYRALRRMILIGDLAPGEKLKIDTLRKKLNTGASPVREALSLLTSDQLVERLDQRGFRTPEVSSANFAEILRLRCSLEDMALRESISRADQAWEEQLVLAHHRMIREPRENIELFEDRHKEFHMALLANCASPILLRFCNQLYDLNIRYRYLAGHAMGYQKRDIAAEHTAILEAAIERNADLASERLISHYQQTGTFLAGLLDGQNG